MAKSKEAIMIGKIKIPMVFATGTLILLMLVPNAALSADRGGRPDRVQQRVPTTHPPAGQTTDSSVNGRVDPNGPVQDPATSVSEARQEAEQAVEAAANIFLDMQADVQERIPGAVMEGAAGIAIFPDVIRVGLIAGGQYGSGVLLSQIQGEWSAPVFISIGGASIGAQVGVEASDLILVFRTLDALNAILAGDHFRLGVDVSIAAGSSGAQAQMTTQDAEVWAYQRNRGLFAGVAVSGAVLALNDERMRAYYDFTEDQAARGYYADGETETAQALLNIGPHKDKQVVQQIPESATTLREALRKYATTQQQ
jgi:SH3 domain-containing YSC84-like protein 1